MRERDRGRGRRGRVREREREREREDPDHSRLIEMSENLLSVQNFPPAAVNRVKLSPL